KHDRSSTTLAGSKAERFFFLMCAVPPNMRVDCAYPGVSPQQCNNRGCCFDSSVPEVPWCYSPLQEEGNGSTGQEWPEPTWDRKWGPIG
uniref:Trefoil factor 3 n=1 Tax=Ornithorhynchus anatinus TaxID=9258 RepID=F6VM99_ORNAN